VVLEDGIANGVDALQPKSPIMKGAAAGAGKMPMPIHHAAELRPSPSFIALLIEITRHIVTSLHLMHVNVDEFRHFLHVQHPLFHEQWCAIMT